MARSLRRLLAGALLAWASAAGAVSPDEVLPDDPRVIEANHLLGDKSRYDEAISLYQQALADHPDDDTARMWLARVLAWQGRYDESLAQFGQFLARTSPPEWAEIERAEVLSWAGRIDEAEIAFQALLAQDPGNARAARGLARVYRWSGRDAEAAETYDRALALQEDAEARKELVDLRAKLGARLAATGSLHHDNDDYWRNAVGSSASVDFGFRTKLLAEVSRFWLSGDRAADETLATVDDSNHLASIGALAGVEQRLHERLVARAWLGGRSWDQGAPDRLHARGELEWSWKLPASTTLVVEHGDFMERSDSIDAVLTGKQETYLRASTWAQLSEPLALFAYQDLSILNDANERVAGGLSVDVTPWPKLPVRISPSFDYLTYTQKSRYYYDPSKSFDGSLTLAGKWQPVESFWLDAVAGGGYGYAKQDGLGGDGFTWRVEGGPTLVLGRFQLSVSGSRVQSRRAGSYKTTGVFTRIGLTF